MNDPMVRIAEIRQDNGRGDVDDIVWLLDVAEAAARVAREASLPHRRTLEQAFDRKPYPGTVTR